MIETAVFCDRCRCVVLENRTLLKVESGPLRRRMESIDLCVDCAGWLLEGWLAEGKPTEHRVNTPEMAHAL